MARRRQEWEIHRVEMDDVRASCSCGWTFGGDRPGVAVKQHSDLNGGATVTNSVPNQNRGARG